MFCTNYFFRNTFYNPCSYIALLAFTTKSTMPLYSYEGEQLSKGFIKKLDPTRKLKKLIKELESFSTIIQLQCDSAHLNRNSTCNFTWN